MIIKNRLFVRLIISLCVITAACYLIYLKLGDPKIVHDPVVDLVMKDARAPEVRTEASEASLTNKQSSSSISSAAPAYNTADAYDNIKWHSDRGYYSAEEQATYKSYSISVLEDMAKNGDVHALHELGSKFLEQGNTTKAKEYFWETAARGSTAVIGIFGLLTEPDYKLNETKEEHKVFSRLGALESFAILKVAAMRGDSKIASVSAISVKNNYEITYKEPLVLTKNELDQIDKRSTEIYKDLQAKRYELGLGDFDNSTSKINDIFFKGK